MVTIKQVAERAGVSPTTASYALNRRPEVKPETIEKVLQAAKELNYTPNFLAKSFRNGKSNTIALITSEDLDNYSIFSLELMGVILEARNLGYDVLVKSVSKDRSLYVDEVLAIAQSRRVDGFLLLGNNLENAIEQLMSVDSKFVLLSSHSKFDINVVNVDGEKWIYNMTEYLIKKGYSNIIYTTYALETVEELNRERGFRRAVNDFGISGEDNVVSCGYENGCIYEAVAKMIDNSHARAIVCWNDTLAMQIVNVLREMGKKVPGDIAVTGFDDIIQDMYFSPALTTIRQPFTEKGKAAVKLLVDIIEDRVNGPVKQLVECKLVTRESA